MSNEELKDNVRIALVNVPGETVYNKMHKPGRTASAKTKASKHGPRAGTGRKTPELGGRRGGNKKLKNREPARLKPLMMKILKGTGGTQKYRNGGRRDQRHDSRGSVGPGGKRNHW